jgi:hypothetical protein
VSVGHDAAAAEVFAVDTSRIATAISYTGDCAGEIDAEAAGSAQQALLHRLREPRTRVV